MDRSLAFCRWSNRNRQIGNSCSAGSVTKVWEPVGAEDADEYSQYFGNISPVAKQD